MAIDDLLDEHEQSERVRIWLRKNGASILGGVAIAIGAIAGWQWYQTNQGGKLHILHIKNYNRTISISYLLQCYFDCLFYFIRYYF